MFGFLNALTDELDKMNLFAMPRTNRLDSGNAIGLFSMPSGRATDYYKGNRQRNGLFQLMVKHTNQTTTSNTIERIAEYIEEAEINLDGYKINKIEVYTEPHYLSGDTQDHWTYNAAFAVEFIKE